MPSGHLSRKIASVGITAVFCWNCVFKLWPTKRGNLQRQPLPQPLQETTLLVPQVKGNCFHADIWGRLSPPSLVYSQDLYLASGHFYPAFPSWVLPMKFGTGVQKLAKITLKGTKIDLFSCLQSPQLVHHLAEVIRLILKLITTERLAAK